MNDLARHQESSPSAAIARPIPVALVITDLDIGGAERALVALATGLDPRRWKPAVIALGPEAALAAPLRAAGIETICLDVDRRRPWQAVNRLAKALRLLRPALVQGFLFHANIASRVAATRVGIRRVLGGLRVAERGSRWHLWVDRLTSRLSSGSVCVSQGVRRHAIERRIQKPDRLFVIPNGIDASRIDLAQPLARTAFGMADTAHLALFVGRIHRQKGVSILIEAARILAQTHPAWRLVIAGDGPQRGELESITRVDASLAKAIIWLGKRDDIPSLLKAADVLVLPSLWEGMPNVVLEAMAAGCPVVATRVEGSEDLVLPGKTGWLVPPGDVRELVSALTEAASDPERLRRFGAAARDRIEAEFSQSAVVRAYDRLWSDLLGAGPDRLEDHAPAVDVP